MKIKLKRLEDQVIVITGGTSGIGLATAKRAAARGARVVLCSRNEAELRETVAAIEERGGTARSVVADVANQDDVERLARLTDFYRERTMFSGQRSDTPAQQREGNLYVHSPEEGREQPSRPAGR